MKVSNLNPNILILEIVGKDFRITVDWTPSKIKTEWITPKAVKNPLRGLNEKQKPSIYGLYGKRVSFKVDVGCGVKNIKPLVTEVMHAENCNSHQAESR